MKKPGPLTIGSRIEAIIREIIKERDFECVDNIRYALIGYEAQEKAYEKQRASGCCGSFDKTIILDGKSYRIGFNHGH